MLCVAGDLSRNVPCDIGFFGTSREDDEFTRSGSALAVMLGSRLLQVVVMEADRSAGLVLDDDKMHVLVSHGRSLIREAAVTASLLSRVGIRDSRFAGRTSAARICGGSGRPVRRSRGSTLSL